MLSTGSEPENQVTSSKSIKLMAISHTRPSNISVNILSHNVEKILVTKTMLTPPTTQVPKFAGIQQLFNHVCHDVGTLYSFAINQGFSRISPLKTAYFTKTLHVKSRCTKILFSSCLNFWSKKGCSYLFWAVPRRPHRK